MTTSEVAVGPEECAVSESGPAAESASRTLDLVWGMTKRPSRGPKPGLSLERIVEAAIAVADAEGLAGFSMSRVAAKLGFTTMSLYRYVATKDELLQLAQDTALAPPPAFAPGTTWRERLEVWAIGNLQVFRRHPWGLDIPVAGLPLLPSGVGWLDAGLGILRDTALRPNERSSSVLLVTSYVRGIAQLEKELMSGAHGREFDSVAAAEAYRAALQRYVPVDRFPFVHEAASHGGFDDDLLPGDDGLDHEFRFGLGRVLDGIAALIALRTDERA